VEEVSEHDQGRVSRLLGFNSMIDRRRALGGGRRDPVMGRSVAVWRGGARAVGDR
jgi:hypothetical protein